MWGAGLLTSVTPQSGEYVMAKTECKVSREGFRVGAKPVRVDLNEHDTLFASVREFQTGSFGWYANGRAQLHLADGTAVDVQVGVTLTVIGSKELPKAA